MPTLRFCRPSCSTMKLRPDAPGIMPPVIRPRIGSPWRGCSILTTSAPQSPSAVPAEGTKPPAARAVFDALARLRRSDAELGRALAALEAQEADLTDHHGIRIASVEEWERRVARALELARTRPDLAVTVVGVERPGDAGAMTDYLYQAWVRLVLLRPWRNTFELQALAAGKEPMR